MIVNGPCFRDWSRLAASTSALALGFALSSSPAHAACVVVAPTSVSCSGANTTTQSVNIFGVTVTTTPGFSVDTTTTGGDALVIFGNGSQVYDDVNASDLTGARVGLNIFSAGNAVGDPGRISITTGGDITGQLGINANNLGSGDVSIVSHGNVRATNGNGIRAINLGNDLSVVAANVAATDSGISVLNNGMGQTVIVATGDVIGDTGHGIDIDMQPTTKGLTLEARNVRGGVSGVSVLAAGSGSTSIITTGNVVGASLDGINYFGGATTGGLFTRVNNVTGAQDGIDIINNGAAVVYGTVVEATGDIVGIAGTGIKVESHVAGLSGKVSIVASNVRGGTDGIDVVNDGLGNASPARTAIVVKGDVVGESRDGIRVLNGATTTDLTIAANNVAGGAFGVFAQNDGTGLMEIVATGDVTGTSAFGIAADNGPTGTNLSVSAVNVTGGAGGISTWNSGVGASRIETTGTATGGNFGILASNDVSATDLTIKAVNSIGGQQGILAINQGVGATSVTATGNAVGTSAGSVGIYAVNDVNATRLTVNAANVTGWDGIFARNDGTGATTITTTGDVAGTNGNFGLYANNGASATDLSVRVANVSHARLQAMSIVNEGTGLTSVTATGDVVGGSAAGMFVRNAATATDLTIEALNVSGRADGISARNEGSGVTAINATGRVVGTNRSGITVVGELNTTGLTVEADSVSGRNFGIEAIARGTGVTRIAATGPVVATNGTGIGAQSVGSALDVEAVDVSGTDIGIDATYGGAGAMAVTATGRVVGADTAGIRALNTGMATDMTINAAAVSSGGIGIDARSSGIGDMRVTATGRVNGAGATAIVVRNDTAGRNITVRTAEVEGGSFGIAVANDGSGATDVTATGPVRGRQTGIAVLNNGLLSSNLTVNAGHVSGGNTGIAVSNTGIGDTTVTATGTVTGDTFAGITAYNFGLTRHLTIEAATANGGIQALNGGLGRTSITATGMVTGSLGPLASAIHASSAGQPIDIVLSGAASGARSRSGLASDLAVTASGGPISLSNEGQMTGGVSFSDAFADKVVNEGTWSVAGVSDFGAGVDTVLNNASGTLRTVGRVQFDNLEGFVSRGMLTMQNGVVGDRFTTSADVVLAAGSRLAIDIDAAGISDSIQTTSTADIDGVALDISAQGLRLGRYTVVTADGGLVGTFGSVTPINSAFAGLIDSYDANNAYLDFLRTREFADAGLTPNQQAAAAGVQSLSGGDVFFAGHPLYDAILALPSDAAARAAFDQISGEAHASAQTALIEDSRFLRDAATSRIRAAFGAVGASDAPVAAFADPIYALPAMAYAETGASTTASVAFAPTTDRFALWGEGFGGWGHSDSDGNAASFKRSTGGFLIGGDAQIFETWRLGMMAGYSHTSVHVRDRTSSGSSDNYHLGVYGGTQWGNLGFRTGAFYTWHDIAMNRSVSFARFGDSLRADYRGSTAQAFGEFGYGFQTGSFGFEPFANLTYLKLQTAGFAERGGVAALEGNDSNTDVTFTTIGVHASTDFDLGKTTATLRGTIGWRHAFGSTLPLSTLGFAGGSTFTVAGVPIAKDAFVLDAGFDIAVTQNATLGISYGGQFGKGAGDQSVKGVFSAKF